MGAPSSVIVAELGPGRGTLMADALRAWRSVPGLLDAHLRRPGRDEPRALRADAKRDAARAPLPRCSGTSASKTCRKARSSSSPMSSSTRFRCGSSCARAAPGASAASRSATTARFAFCAGSAGRPRRAAAIARCGMDAAEGAIVETRPAAASLLVGARRAGEARAGCRAVRRLRPRRERHRRYAAGGAAPSLRRSARRAGRSRPHRPCRFRRAQGDRDARSGSPPMGRCRKANSCSGSGSRRAAIVCCGTRRDAQRAAIVSGAARLADPRQMGLLFKMLVAAIERACPAASLRRHLASDCAPHMVTPDKMKLCASEPRRDRRRAATDSSRARAASRAASMPRSIAGRARATTAANVAENRARVAELLGAEPSRLHHRLPEAQRRCGGGREAVEGRQDARGRRHRHREARARHRHAHRRLRAGPVLRRRRRGSSARRMPAGGARLSGIIEATVEAMSKLGAEPERITAAIGPAISQKAYEVGADFVERFLADEPASAAFFITDEGSGEPHFDLAGLCRRAAGAGRRRRHRRSWPLHLLRGNAAVQLSPVATSWRGRLRPPNFRHPARLTCASHGVDPAKNRSTL